MKRAVRSAASVFVLALLGAACTEQAAAPAEQGEAAAGTVLPGTISDAMIPLDQLQSQAPLAPREGPAPADIDSEQPQVTPAAGINDPVAAAAADTQTPAPAPAPAAEPLPAD